MQFERLDEDEQKASEKKCSDEEEPDDQNTMEYTENPSCVDENTVLTSDMVFLLLI